MNEILLRRKNKVILGTGTARVANDRYITAIMKNIEELDIHFPGRYLMFSEHTVSTNCQIFTLNSKLRL